MSSEIYPRGKARIAILAALPREIQPLIKNWPVRSVSRREGFLIAEGERSIAVCAGMGAERVTYALQLAERRGPLREVISVGYAGALRPEITVRSLFWPSTVIDALTGKRYGCEQGTGTIVSTDHVVNYQEKPLLAALWNADLVDMEAATVARLAHARGLPFRTLRVVSDEAEEVLPDLDRFTDALGGFREAAFAGYLLLHPWLIPATIRMGIHATRASEILSQELRVFLAKAQ